jgi:hypothetical protein
LRPCGLYRHQLFHKRKYREQFHRYTYHQPRYPSLKLYQQNYCYVPHLFLKQHPSASLKEGKR